MTKETIYGCEGRGDGDSPYLTRWTLLEAKNWQLCVHKFHRSDHDDLHDHPWDFITIPLWRGYKEEVLFKETPPRCKYCNSFMYRQSLSWACIVGHDDTRWAGALPRRIQVLRPFGVYFRKAEHAHRVVLHRKRFRQLSHQEYAPGKRAMGWGPEKEVPATTLIFMFKRRREWGFFQHGHWTQWQTYFRRNKC